MANENNQNEDLENQNDQGLENQQQGNQQQQDDRDPLDKMVDEFLQDTSREPRKTVENQGQQNQEGQQNKGQQQEQRKPNEGQQQQGQPNNQGSNQNQGLEPPPSGTRKFGNLFHQDGRGNIFNAKGELVAGAGAPHKLFRKLWPYIEKSEIEAAGYKARLDAFDNANAAAKAAGLNADEYGAAIGFMAAFKKDPKAAVQFVLQQAQNRGTDLSDILQGGGGLNEATLRTAVQEIVKEALTPFAPFIQQNEQQQQLREMQESAQQEYTAFIQEYPDATPHRGHIASIMEGTGKDMIQSYFVLKTWALEKGLDWSKPLGQQVEALKQRGNNHAPNGGGNNHLLPDFGGRTGQGGAVPNRGGLAKADDSWDSIIAESVREATQGQQRN